MESIIIDHYSPMNPRKSFGVNGGGALLRSYHSFSAAPSLHRSLLDSVYGGAPAYASLPLLPSAAAAAAALSPPRPLLQPPLLPLPFPKPAARRAAQRKKPRPAARKERRVMLPGPKTEPVSTPEVTEKPEEKEEIVFVASQRSAAAAEEEKGMELRGSLYSISPPPSSLPLPRFSVKPKRSVAAAASCTVEAMGGGGAVDAGATDDLRRLLRL